MVCGWLALRLRQARVIGEIVGGILLGPSLLGHFFPDVFERLFPKGSLAPFEVLSTVGLILFLFMIGAEMDIDQLYRHRATAVVTSIMSILLPFAFAAALAHSLFIRFAPQGIGSVTFILFLGIAMSITAFPVLARILEERKLLGSSLGTTAIFCAAVGDVIAWLLLAFAVALLRAHGGPVSLPLRLLELLVYLVVMLGIIRPLAAWLLKRQRTSEMSLETIGLTLAGLFASAAATESMGVHPLFGAFVAGVCFPRNRQWQIAVRGRLQTIVSVLLLPLFFALTGMRTRVDLLNDATVWFWFAIVLLASVLGKMGGAALAARWTGWSWRDGWSLGALLNTRGLVELIVLNVAFDVGVFSPTLFTMLVLMAIVTTATTSPILDLLRIEGGRTKAVAPVGAILSGGSAPV